MHFLKSRTSRLVGLLAALAMLVGALVVGVGSAAADTFSFPLLPVAGANSSGSGIVSVTPFVGTILVQIDLNGARAGNSYNFAICSNTGVALSCTSGGTITTDATGSFHGSVFAGSSARTDLLTLVNTVDPSDAYQAVTGTMDVSSTPFRGVAPIYPDPSGMGVGYPGGNSTSFFITTPGTLPAGAVTAPDGSILFPATGGNLLSFACPVGYSGPLLLPNPLNATATILIMC